MVVRRILSVAAAILGALWALTTIGGPAIRYFVGDSAAAAASTKASGYLLVGLLIVAAVSLGFLMLPSQRDRRESISKSRESAGRSRPRYAVALGVGASFVFIIAMMVAGVGKDLQDLLISIWPFALLGFFVFLQFRNKRLPTEPGS